MKVLLLIFVLFLSACSSVITAPPPLNGQKEYAELFKQKAVADYLVIMSGGANMHGLSNHANCKHPPQIDGSDTQPKNNVFYHVKAKKYANELTNCHMEMIFMFPENIQQAAFSSALKGNSYEAANLAFSRAIKRTEESSNAAYTEIGAIKEKALHQAQLCMPKFSM